MFTPAGFHSFSEYWQFVWAREFRDVENHERVEYTKTSLEILGDLTVHPLRIVDYSMRNIRNPAMIATVALAAIVAVTILFYPKEFMHAVTKIIPQAQQVKPWMIKLGLFTFLQMIILGIEIRTLGRLNSSGDLWNLWTQNPRSIIPITLGTEVVRVEI